MIYYDSTEARVGTRLPQEVIEAGLPVYGLEHWTGADILISTKDGEMPSNVMKPPGSLIWQSYVNQGMLIQRKSGNDLLGSLPNLHNLILRMRLSGCKMSWLMVCGEYEQAGDKVAVDGIVSGYHWNAYKSISENWQAMGGYYHEEVSDAHCGQWILKWDKKFPMLLADIEKGLKEKPITPEVGNLDPQKNRITLMTFPGVGDHLSLDVLEHNGRLCDALVWLSQPKAFGVKGFGVKTNKRCREWLELMDGEALAVIRDKPTFGGK